MVLRTTVTDDGRPGTTWIPPQQGFVKYFRPRVELSERLDVFSRSFEDPRPCSVAFPKAATATRLSLPTLKHSGDLSLNKTWSTKSLRQNSSITSSRTSLSNPTGARRDIFVTERLGKDAYTFTSARNNKVLQPSVGLIRDTDTVEWAIAKLNDAYPDEVPMDGHFTHFPPQAPGIDEHAPPKPSRNVHTVLVGKFPTKVRRDPFISPAAGVAN